MVSLSRNEIMVVYQFEVRVASAIRRLILQQEEVQNRRKDQ